MSEEFKALHSLQGFLDDYYDIKALRGKERVEAAFKLLTRIRVSIDYFVELNKAYHATKSRNHSLEARIHSVQDENRILQNRIKELEVELDLYCEEKQLEWERSRDDRA